MRSLLAIISSLFISIAIFFIDDAHDYESDRIVHPQRPIPKGLITVNQAYIVGATLLFMGIIFASTLLLYQFVMFLALTIMTLTIIFFNFQSTLRALIIAFLIWGLFPFSAFLDLKTALFGLIVALPHVGGSITKDFLHSSGDQIQGLKPPPKWSKYLASLAFFLSGAIVWLPKILGFVNWLYLPPIIFTHVTCMVLGVSILKGNYQKVYTYGRIGMFSSLIAFLIGQL